MHPQGVVLNLFGSVCPECRGEKESKGRVASFLLRRFVASSSRRLVASSSRRFVASSSRRFVVSSLRRLVASSLRRFVASSSRRLVVSSLRRLAFVSPEGGGGGKKRGRWDELNQRGSKRPLEDAL